MRQRELMKLKAIVAKLTFAQRQAMIDELAAEDDATASIGIIEAQGKSDHCPHCGSGHVVRNGSASGLQRYKCRSCRRTFNALTGTPLARLRHKSKWLTQAEVLCDGVTITQASELLKVARSTAFRWRHRFMALPKTVQAQSLAGIAEADETFFLYSCKGQRGLDRKPRRRGGNVSAGRRVIAGVYHIQNVNAYDSRLKNWIRRFHGIATKYLDSYLGWFRTLDRSATAGLQPASLLAFALGSRPRPVLN